MKSLPASLAVVGALTLAACDIPTSPPRVEQRWILPVERATLGVAELLPDGVEDDGSFFLVSVAPVTVVERLTDVCEGCAALDGLVAPKPGFEDSLQVTTTLPDGVSGADLASASVQVVIHNAFGFDPLRPGGPETGTLSVEVRAGVGGEVLGRLTMDGAIESLPAGATVSRTLSLEAAALGTTLQAVVSIASPAGNPVVIDADDELTVTATPTLVRLASALVDVTGEVVTLDPVALDVEGIDEAVTDHILTGAILLDVVNPFGVAVDALLEIRHPDGSVVKAVTLGADASSTISVPYTADELRSFLGRTGVDLVGTGSVAPGAGLVTLVPGQEMVLDGKIDLTLSIGG
jgi:hypothetical protein